MQKIQIFHIWDHTTLVDILRQFLKFLLSYYIVRGSIPTLGILIFAYLNTLRRVTRGWGVLPAYLYY